MWHKWHYNFLTGEKWRYVDDDDDGCGCAIFLVVGAIIVLCMLIEVLGGFFLTLFTMLAYALPIIIFVGICIWQHKNNSQLTTRKKLMETFIVVIVLALISVFYYPKVYHISSHLWTRYEWFSTGITYHPKSTIKPFINKEWSHVQMQMNGENNEANNVSDAFYDGDSNAQYKNLETWINNERNSGFSSDVKLTPVIQSIKRADNNMDYVINYFVYCKANGKDQDANNTVSWTTKIAPTNHNASSWNIVLMRQNN